MREILFKGKRKDNGKWVEGYYQQRYDDFENIQHLIFWAKSYTVWEYAEVISETVCQYTGLTDKNGMKIFEGDIVRNFLCIDDHREKLYEIGVVRYDEETFGFSTFDEENSRYNMRFMGNIEVIGNIFDNPGLVESND